MEWKKNYRLSFNNVYTIYETFFLLTLCIKIDMLYKTCGNIFFNVGGNMELSRDCSMPSEF